jgi:hypothetical protein
MTKTALPTTCPDCAGPMREVTLFARSALNPISGAAIDSAVAQYTDRSLMCHICGRLFLYGIPKSDADLPVAETIDCLHCGTPIDASQSNCPKCGWSYSE